MLSIVYFFNNYFFYSDLNKTNPFNQDTSNGRNGAKPLIIYE